jgi:hypothetical protein
MVRPSGHSSDHPVILLSTGGAIQSPVTNRALQELIDVANIYVVERPARKATRKCGISATVCRQIDWRRSDRRGQALGFAACVNACATLAVKW